MLKNSSTLAASVPIKLSIKLVFVSVNVPMKTYFVDALPDFTSSIINIRASHKVTVLIAMKLVAGHEGRDAET